jgi:uncharacterized membrane protein YeiH
MLYVPTLLQAIDMIGTFVFAISGAVAGVRRGLDLFGVLVVGLVAAVFGGITRDVLIGAVPPDAFLHPHYMVLAAAAGLFTFHWYPLVARFTYPVRLFDAARPRAVRRDRHGKGAAPRPGRGIAAALLGMVTAIGGGVVRDILLAQVPVVLRSDIYAVAALAGALIVVAGDQLGLPEAPVALRRRHPLLRRCASWRSTAAGNCRPRAGTPRAGRRLIPPAAPQSLDFQARARRRVRVYSSPIGHRLARRGRPHLDGQILGMRNWQHGL